MRIGDVISALSVLVCSLAIQGCAGFIGSEATPAAADWQPALDQPMTIRTLGSDQRFSQLSSASVAERLRAVRGGEPLSILALSGGGAFGAFGAGAMVGLTRSGTRPEFAVVTGISTGALIAPYAFLGPTWDARLREVYTSGAADHLLQSRGLGVLFGSSLYSGKPLQQLVDAYAFRRPNEIVGI
jgi:predicted acylesterase/phospholipase RssA